MTLKHEGPAGVGWGWVFLMRTVSRAQWVIDQSLVGPAAGRCVQGESEGGQDRGCSRGALCSSSEKRRKGTGPERSCRGFSKPCSGHLVVLGGGASPWGQATHCSLEAWGQFAGLRARCQHPILRGRPCGVGNGLGAPNPHVSPRLSPHVAVPGCSAPRLAEGGGSTLRRPQVLLVA